MLVRRMKGIGLKRHSYFYSVVLEFCLCYSYLSGSTLRTSSGGNYVRGVYTINI